jgi:hypothetical protein
VVRASAWPGGSRRFGPVPARRPDCLDPAEGRANRYAAPAGLRRNDLSHAFTIIEGSGCHVVAGAITAYDEASDLDGRMATCADEIVAEMARRFGEK